MLFERKKTLTNLTFQLAHGQLGVTQVQIVHYVQERR